jgi:hypothetical protein
MQGNTGGFQRKIPRFSEESKYSVNTRPDGKKNQMKALFLLFVIFSRFLPSDVPLLSPR